MMSQTPAPPLPALPSGFQSDPAAAQAQAQIRASGAADATGGSKANEDVPGCPTLRKIGFSYSWTIAFLGQGTVQVTPQDPAKSYGMSLDEPVSKIAYKNGVLEWRKDTEQIAGYHAPCPGKFVYYNGTWTGYFPNKVPYQPGKLVSIQVTNLYKSQAQGQAWIDEYIDKLTALYGGK
jgi:hypothetical protein